MGHDLSDVRIHTNSLSKQSAHAIGANAYTVGSHVVFGSSELAPRTTSGLRLLAHELTHVVQQRGSGARWTGMNQRPNTLAPATTAPSGVYRDGGLAQRGPDPYGNGQATTGPLIVPYEKWGPSVEESYRQAGLIREAAAVRGCRETGKCQKLLTELEAWQAYGLGRLANGLPAPSQQSGLSTGSTATFAFLGPLPAIGTGTGAGVGAGAAGGTGAAVGTAAVPIAVGVVVVVALISLHAWTSFQVALEAQGYVILTSPLAVCIGNCHRPAAPRFNPRLILDDLTPLRWPVPGEFTGRERQQLEDWLRKQPIRPPPSPAPIAPPSAGTKVETQTEPRVVPQERTSERTRRGRHTCFGRSFVLQIPNQLPEHRCPDSITSTRQDGPSVSGSSQAEACLAAKHAFNATMPRGCRPKHLKCICSVR